MTPIPGFKFAFRLIVLCLTVGCNPSPSNPAGLPTTTMKIGKKTYTLEIAADDATRTKGLMERDGMPTDHGMIFVFPEPTEEGFWMYHTRFPLDIIFIGADCKVISTATMQPYDKTTTPSGGPEKYAIELWAGQLDENGVKPGDRISIPALGAK